MHSSTLQPAFDRRNTSAKQEDTGSKDRTRPFVLLPLPRMLLTTCLLFP